MKLSGTGRIIKFLIFYWIALAGGSLRAVAADGVRSMAVVDLTFDEQSGDANNSAAAAKNEVTARLQHGARRTESPFWNHAGRRALVLDAKDKQYVELTGATYLDRPDAVSVSFLFLSTHDFGDDTFHGLAAKRSAQDQRTNYGINFNPKSNALQLYVNDGSGFRSAVYSVSDTIGSRRLVHVTATWQVADAPAPDEDTNKDDVLVRLFLNGEPIGPESVGQGHALGSDAWLVDVDAASLLNDVPLTIGSSTPETEFTSGLFDEFLLFARALTPQEAARLFTEVAGPDGVELARRELQRKAKPQPPRIARLSLWGLQLGATTRLTVVGERLGLQPRIVLPLPGLKQEIVDASNPNRLVVELEVPDDGASGYYPLCVQTRSGLSNTVAVAVDVLPQRSAADVSQQSPVEIPAAYSGVLTGEQQARIYFNGSAGQRIVADVEAMRLGADMDPVLEVKNARGTPLLIEWGKVYLRGDARADLVLAEDGLYFVELHDLSYKAGRNSPFRLKIGNLKLVDALFPPAVSRSSQIKFEPIGIGFDSTVHVAAKISPDGARPFALLPREEKSLPMGPAPAVALSDAKEIIETDQPAGQLQTVSALFVDHKHVPIAISGRLALPGQVDTYLLVVTPGEKYDVSLEGRSIDSPIDASLAVIKHPEGTQLANSDDRPGSRDPRLRYTVPEDVHEIQLAVSDLHGRGGGHYLYRLRIVPAGQPDFSLRLAAPTRALPADGTALARLEVNRRSYGGPIKLSVRGDEQVSVAPAEVPPGNGTQTVLVTFVSTGGEPGDLKQLRLIGESIELDPPIRRAATISAGEQRIDVAGFRDWLPVSILEPTGFKLKLNEKPPALFKGVPSAVSLGVERSGDDPPPAARLNLISTEKPRRVDPRDPNKGNKPLVRTAADGTVFPQANASTLDIAVPLDVAESEINFVVRADVVPHVYSPHVAGSAFSLPFRLPVREAASVELDKESLKLTAGAENKIRGSLSRSEGFAQPVDVELSGLPEEYSAAKVRLAADQQQFEFAVTVPKQAEPGQLPNVKLRVLLSGGGPIQPDRPVGLEIAADSASSM